MYVWEAHHKRGKEREKKRYGYKYGGMRERERGERQSARAEAKDGGRERDGMRE